MIYHKIIFKFIVRSAYDSDLRLAKISLRDVASQFKTKTITTTFEVFSSSDFVRLLIILRQPVVDRKQAFYRKIILRQSTTFYDNRRMHCNLDVRRKSVVTLPLSVR